MFLSFSLVVSPRNVPVLNSFLEYFLPPLILPEIWFSFDDALSFYSVKWGLAVPGEVSVGS